MTSPPSAPAASPGTRVVAWSLWSVACLTSLAAVVFVATTEGLGPPIWGMRLSAALWAVAFATVGAVLATRLPRNPIGWLLLVAGITASTVAVAGEVSAAAPAVGQRTADVAFWFGSWAWIPTVGAVAAAILLFPDGRPASAGWRRLLVVHGALTVVVPVIVMVVPALDKTGRITESPLWTAPEWMVGPATVLLTVWQVLLAAVLASVIARRNGADAVRRLQLRWVAFAAGIVAVVALVTEVPYSLRLIDVTVYTSGTVLLGLAIALLPVAIGVAVLRYRLYEIDRIISRTVVYVLVTALLGAGYLVMVLTLQVAFTFRSGGLPDVAIAATTLVVAGAFAPVRRRVQDVVDRRFHREHHDAARLIERFGADLRQQVEHAAVERLLRQVAHDVVEPASVSVWVRRAD